MRFSRLSSLCALFLTLPGVAGAGHIIISELMYNPAGTKAEWIEVTNVSTNRLDMAAWKLSGGANLNLPDFDGSNVNAHLLLGRERILFSSKSPTETRADYPNIPANVRIFGPWTGALDNSGETIVIQDKNGARLNSLGYGDSGRKWPAAPDGTGHSLVLVNENRAVDDWHNWKSSANPGGTPGSVDILAAEEPAPDPSSSAFAEAVPMTASWHFYKETAAPPADWNSRTFVPNGFWGSGPALLGFETAALPAPGLLTPFANANVLTYYFRTSFNWTGGTGGAQFEMDTILDDGATYYLNGVYIGNKDGVASVIHNSSIATVTVGDAALVEKAVTGTIPAGILVDGVNVLSAVAFQVNTTSSDMVFGTNLRLANAGSGGSELAINEIRQAGPGAGFIEFHNPGAVPVDLNGYFLTDTAGAWTKFPINRPVVVPAGGLATVGFTEFGFSATAATTTLYLSRPNGTVITGLVAALPQDGRSLGRKPVGGSSWFKFTSPTPGLPNASGGGGASGTVPALNEIHFDAATGLADWVELTNTGSGSLDLAGLYLASTKTFADRVPLSGSLASRGFVSTAVNFAPDAGGKLTVFLVDGSNTVIAEAEVERRKGKASSQAWPAGSSEFYATAVATRDTANLPDRTGDVVISEIMYNPPSEHRQGEFIELFNRGTSPVDVGGWNFTSGVTFTIPGGTVMAPGARLVVAQDAAFITANYPAAGAVVGGFGGSLGNSGELIRLEDAEGNLADEVDYRTGGDWPRLADGLGASIELINPAMDNGAGSSWAASDDSAKGQWTSFTHTGVYYGVGPLITPEIHFNLVGDGHLVVRNLTYGVTGGAASPVAAAISPTNSGADGWRVTGTHWATFADTEGLHIVADGAGDMKGNHIERDVAQVSGTSYTINFQARWVSGLSRLVLVSQDRTWGRTFSVPVPNNLGTPGAPNSRAVAAAAPEVWSMLHSPAVPKATEDVKVTARVSSSLPLASVSVVHRLDSITGANAWTTTAMNDNGTAGDAVAGDGNFTATLSSYKSEGAIVEFYIQAAASGGGVTTYPAGGVNAPGLWIVDSTPVASDLLVQRVIMSEQDRDSIGPAGVSATFNYRHPRMSNHYYNSTHIMNEREIIYNVESRKSGSPWTRVNGNDMDRVRSKFPKDRMFRGREKTGADNDAADTGARRWNNRVDRYWLYLLGYPQAEAEFIHMQFNNLPLSLKDDTEPTDTDMLDRTYENSGSSELHEIDDAWYFGDDLASENRSQVNGDWVYDVRFKENPVYWHGSWPIRTQSERYDFSGLTSWIRTMYNNGVTPANDSAADETYRASVESIFDVDKFGRYAAVKGWAGAWDNFTIDRGKNGFVYRRPTDGRWEFEFWDGDLDFQNTAQSVLGGIPGTGPFFSRPWFRRAMNYYLQEIRDKWSLDSPRMYAWLQAMEDQSPSYSIDQNYFKSWFSGRRPTIDAFIGTGNQTIAFTAAASPGSPTALNLTALNGNAPTLVDRVTVDGHPEGSFRWLSASTWTMSGIYLKNGLNTLTVRAWDRQGVARGVATVNITKTGDAPPVLAVTSDPGSFKAAVGEAVTIDSAGSFDPEGTALALNWTIAPLTGVAISPSGTTGRRLTFSIPGIYTVILSGTDAAGSASSLTRQITIYSSGDFASFGSSLVLGPGLTAANTEIRDNSSPASWYSLEDATGRLLLQVSESAPAPLDSPIFPSITRPLPGGSNWIMQTDVRLETRRLGEYFNTGLMVDTLENGEPARYVYSIETGNQVAVRRADSQNAFYTPYVTPSAIRINCGGPALTEAGGNEWVADTGYLAVPATNTISQSFTPTTSPNTNYATVGDTRRTGVSGGAVIYEIPVAAWPNNYNLTLSSATVAASSQTISMTVTINDGAVVSNWSANSSPSQIRQLNLSNVARNNSGKIKIALTRNATTTAGAEAGISGIEIVPSTTPPSSGTLSALTPAPMTADALRVERNGSSLIFSRLAAGVWVVDRTLALPDGATAVKGGIFASTETAQNLKASFDYLLIADPAKAATVLASLRLTELMYNPGAGGVEFLEFQNTGAAPINLQGVNLPAGSPFAAYSFGDEMLAPGEFIVLTGNPEGFRAKYGLSPRLAAGQWVSGSLDNGGERIVVNDAGGNVIHDFVYDDAAPWPLAADGAGPSLEVIDLNADYNDPLNWRASVSSVGTPGGTSWAQDEDSDGDGVPDWVESAFGLPPNSPGQQPSAASTTAGGVVTISWPFAAGRSYKVECSQDLLTWQTIATVAGGSFADPASAGGARCYYRVTALP